MILNIIDYFTEKESVNLSIKSRDMFKEISMVADAAKQLIKTIQALSPGFIFLTGFFILIMYQRKCNKIFRPFY